MKILAIADEESKSLWDYYDPERLRGVDLILSAGDLSPAYLEFLVTLTNCTLLYVRGNHDNRYDKEPPGGCMRYNNGNNQYTENEMRRRVRMAEIRAVLMNGFDIMLTHAPARGYGDMNDLPHMGFECFNPLLEKWKPRYFIHGHVHKSYGHFNPVATHSGGTTIVNCFDHQIIDFPESDFPAKGQTGSPLYDLYISLQERRRL